MEQLRFRLFPDEPRSESEIIAAQMQLTLGGEEFSALQNLLATAEKGLYSLLIESRFPILNILDPLTIARIRCLACDKAMDAWDTIFDSSKKNSPKNIGYLQIPLGQNHGENGHHAHTARERIQNYFTSLKAGYIAQALATIEQD